jgi:Uma2 family endonuclease
MTPEEYLEFERTSELKHEYCDGEIFAMTGARPNHNGRKNLSGKNI